jgi:hypothetical protein
MPLVLRRPQKRIARAHLSNRQARLLVGGCSTSGSQHWNQEDHCPHHEEPEQAHCRQAVETLGAGCTTTLRPHPVRRDDRRHDQTNDYDVGKGINLVEQNQAAGFG